MDDKRDDDLPVAGPRRVRPQVWPVKIPLPDGSTLEVDWVEEPKQVRTTRINAEGRPISGSRL